MKPALNRLDDFMSRIEKGLIVILLTTMVLVAITQIIMRNAFSTGLSWGEPLVRYLVLWVGFIGAALATRESKHITIELFSIWKRQQAGRFIGTISHLSAAIICGLLAAAAVKFLWFEAQLGSTTFFHLPVWLPEIVIPLTFSTMTLRYLFKALAVICGQPEEDLASDPQDEL